MNGQSFVLLAVGVFTALVVTVATLNNRLLVEHPASEASGLLWRVERALNSAQDLEMELISTRYDAPDEPVRMSVQVVVGPSPVLSLRYTEPEAVRDQVILVESDLLSHYMPQEDLVVVRRWTGLPLASVGLAALDVSQLRADLQRGAVTARVLDDAATLSIAAGADVPLGETLAGTLLDEIPEVDASALSVFDPSLPGFAIAPPGGLADSARGSYVIEVRDGESGQLTRALWIDRGTYFIEKIIYFQDERRDRALEVESLRINQGLTADDLLVRPRAAVTIRG